MNEAVLKFILLTVFFFIYIITSFLLTPVQVLKDSSVLYVDLSLVFL